MVTLYFYWKDYAPVMRCWSYVPRRGDMVVLPEFGRNLNGLQVYHVVCEGYDEPSISIYLHRARTDRDRDEAIASDDGDIVAN